MYKIFYTIMKRAVAEYSSARPIEIVTGEGCELIDRAGKRYLDFIGGWCVATVGYKHPAILQAMTKALHESVYVPALFHDPGQAQLAQLLMQHAPGKLARAFRCTSGSEAVEFAIKCARAATKKPLIVSIDHVYHGHTYGAASVGDAYQRLVGPHLPGFLKLPMPDARTGVTADVVVSQFEQMLREHHNIAAFLSEPIWTNGGVIIPPADFYPRIAQLCHDYDVLLVMDEVATGFGRCGKLFASEWWNLKPDIMCLGKGLSGGYGTIGATLVTEDVFQRSAGIPAYSTFGWLMIDRVAAHANVECILKEKLWNNAARIGEQLVEQFHQALDDHPLVSDIRGLGLVIGIDLPDSASAETVRDQCAAAGLLLETIDRTLFMTPPLILSAADATRGADIIVSAIQKSTL